MRTRSIGALLSTVVLLVLLAGGGPPPGAAPGGATSAYAPGEVLIKFRPEIEDSIRLQVRRSFDADLLHSFRSRAEHWRLGPGRDVQQALAQLKANRLVQYAEPNYYLKLDIVPNDPRFGELYGLRNTGQSGGTAGADIDAVLAWNVSVGGPNVLVGVIDTGCDYNHPDLAPNIWTNLGEVPGNGVDDDGNGYVDDVHGYDFYNNDGDPFDDHGHGTHVSGTIGAVGDNGLGVVGVNWQVQIMCVKFLGSGGSGTTANAVLSVDYATAMGVDLTSNSWGGGGFSQTLYDAIARAGAQEIAFVAAAGNDGVDNDTSPHYPSNYDLANLISVAATDRNDAKASFSNWGRVSVDLGAPGVDILSTLPGSSYGTLSGTSMATPHVSGVLALMRALNPNIGVAQMKSRLLSSVDLIASMNGKVVSNGRLNAFFTIAEPDTTPPGPIVDLAVADPTSNTMGLAWTATGDDGGVGTASYYELRYSLAPIDDANWPSATRAGNEPTPAVAGSAETIEVRGLAANTFYYFALKAFDEWGNPGPLSNLASASTQPPPSGSIAPTALEDALLTGQQSDQLVTLSHVGLVGTLDFTIPTPVVGEPLSAPAEPLVLGKDEADPRHGDPVIANRGGPDGFGYRWIDSDEPGGPTFSWTDISGTGTPLALTGDDATTAPIALGFNVPFYGTFFDSIRVCSNGWISFTSSSTAYSNQPLPTTGAPENLIAPFWDDLNPGGTNRTFFQQFGNRAIVQWQEIPHYGTTETGTYTFQAIIDASGAITYQYLTMVGALNSATIGIQDAAKTTGLQVAFNQAYVHDGLAVRIVATPQWLTAFPTSGRLLPGQSKLINVHMDASGLEGGDYPGTVNIATNDPEHPLLAVSVLLHVTGAPQVGVQPSSLVYGDVFVGVAKTLTLIVANEGTDVLHVADVLPSGAEVAATPRTFDLAPHSSQNVSVTWTPAIPGSFSGSVTIQSDDATNPSLVVPLTGVGLVAPVMVFDPTSFNETLYTAQQVTRSLTVYNTGGSDLIVDAAADQGNGVLVRAGEEGALGSGGPDLGGYRWKDSDASGGPTYNWIDISATGTPISFSSPDYGIAGPFALGMTFPFYDGNFTQFKVSANGWLTFDTADSSGRDTNYNLPSASGAKYMVCPFWDDLHLRTGNVKYLYDGTRFILQYTGVGRYTPSSGQSYTFQVQLHPNGKILFMYQSMSTGYLNSATIGIQNGDRTIGLPVNYNANYVHNALAVQISKTPDWLLVTPAHAVIPPGGNSVFDVKFDATDRMGSVLNGAVVLTNNLPDEKRVPAQLTVIGVPVAGVIPASYDYGSRYVGYSHLTSFQVVNNGTDVLNVTDVTTTHGSLTVLEPQTNEESIQAAFPLPPGGARLFNLRWLPTVAGALSAAVHIYSDDPVTPDKVMPVSGNAIPPPVAVSSPASFTESLLSGEVVHRALHVENQGGSNLTYSTDVQLNSGAVVPIYDYVEVKKDDPDPRPGILGSGGPDTFGYRWRDSDALNGPVFNWVDITSVGTPIPLNGDDQNLGTFPIGFDFPFYGQTFNSFRACTNGWLSFTSTSTSLSNSALPSTGAPENLLAVFWDDMDFRTSGRAYYYNDGGRLIVSYVAAPRYSSGGPYTYQVILYPTGRIVYQYLDMQGTRLNEATIGVQNAAKNDGLTVVFNAAYVHNGLAVEFSPPASWLKVVPREGVLAPGASIDLDVEINATGLIGGDYAASIKMTTNDPVNALIETPVSLHVTGIPDIDANPLSLTFPLTYVGYSRALGLTIKNSGTDVVHITDLSLVGDFALTGLTPPVDIPVYGSIPVTVTFSPTAPGTLSGSISLTSNDPDENPFVIPLEGLALIPPVISVAPPSFTESLMVGDVVHRTLHVTNEGGSDLTFTAEAQAAAGAAVPVYEYVELKKDDADARPGVLGAGGPDAFGYKWKDSDDPGGPAFGWVDITGIGTPIALTGDDQNVGPLPIGFEFPFYGQTFNSLRACSNGWLSFTNTSSSLSNSALPSSGAPENLLAPFWDDLSFSASHGSAQAYYHNDGGRFIVSYLNVPHYPSTGTGPYTFQVILYPSGRIVYQYLTMGATLNSATIGVQDGTKTDGLTVVFNADYVHNNLAIEFRPPAAWLSVSPTEGTLGPGASLDLDVAIDAQGMIGGDYVGSVELTSNDPAQPVVQTPVQLHLTGIPDVAVDPAALLFPMTYVGYSSTLPLTITSSGTDVLHITDVTVTGDFSQTGLTPPVDLPVYGSIPLTVAFAPSAPGTRSGSITLTSDDPDESPLVIPLEGSALLPPVVNAAPPEIRAVLPPDGTANRTLTIGNTGGSDLNWTAAANILSAAGTVTRYEPLELGKDDVDPRPGILGSGGPDLFGYRWRDSDDPEGPVFGWIDISAVGTPIPFGGTYKDDGNSGPLPIGFPFSFYGQSFTEFRACTNGWVSFTNNTTTYTNQPLPNAGAAVPENLLAVFWDDMVYDESYGSSAYYYYDGTRTIIQFNSMRRIAEYSTFYWYEVILYPSGRIVYQYLTLGATTNSSTIGMQNAAKDDGLTVAFNASYLHGNMAIEFTRFPEWVTLATTGGVIPPGGSVAVDVLLDAAGLSHGWHEANITISSNDPHTPALVVPVDLGVNYKPVAAAATPEIAECTANNSAVVMLNGGGSSDPDGDGLTYAWSAPGIAFDDPASVTPSASFPVGDTAVTLLVNDSYENSDPATVTVSVRDTQLPLGAITAPPAGACFGPAALPVTVTDDFADVCDPGLLRSYTPGPGPSYDTHGDHNVVLVVSDHNGNAAAPTSVTFTIDTTAPRIDILLPAEGQLMPLSSLPLDLVYSTNDDDRATGGVIHELLKLRPTPEADFCTVYDGWTYGDRDGVLNDETLQLTRQELCWAARHCGFTLISKPTIRVEAEDCGQNVSHHEHELRAFLRMANVCGQDATTSAPTAGRGLRSPKKVGGTE